MLLTGFAVVSVFVPALRPDTWYDVVAALLWFPASAVLTRRRRMSGWQNHAVTAADILAVVVLLMRCHAGPFAGILCLMSVILLGVVLSGWQHGVVMFAVSCVTVTSVALLSGTGGEDGWLWRGPLLLALALVYGLALAFLMNAARNAMAGIAAPTTGAQNTQEDAAVQKQRLQEVLAQLDEVAKERDKALESLATFEKDGAGKTGMPAGTDARS